MFKTIDKLDEYQVLASRTLTSDMTRHEASSMLSMGLAGEAGEVVDLLKKHLYHGHPLNEDQLSRELGDLLWYVAGLCTEYGVDLSTVASMNIEKLNRRYPEGFSHEASRNRRD